MTQFDNHPLAEAARINDAVAEEHGFQEAVAMLGLDLEAVAYVSHQRALRAVLFLTRGEKAMRQYAGKPMPTVIPLSELERNHIEQLRAVLLDGICLGWKAAQLSDAPG